MKSKVEIETNADKRVKEVPPATLTYQERLWRQVSRFGPALMLLVVVAGMSIAHADFLTISNVMTIGLQAAVRALLAIRAHAHWKDVVPKKAEPWEVLSLLLALLELAKLGELRLLQPRPFAAFEINRDSSSEAA